MEENQTTKWTIIDSVNLTKLYPLNETSILVYSSMKIYNQLSQFFNEFKVPYYLIDYELSKNNYAYFGKDVNFQNLYVIAGILKSYGYERLYYNSKLNKKITIGSSKRITIDQKKTCIRIDYILSLPFSTNLKDIISDLFPKHGEKVNINDFGIKHGLIKEKDIHKPDHQVDEHGLESDDSKDYESSYDPYEDFHWGGLSGEEAHTAYWNCD